MASELKSVIIQNRWLKDNRWDVLARAISILEDAWQKKQDNLLGFSGQQIMQLAGMLNYYGMNNEYVGPHYRPILSGMSISNMDMKIILDTDGIFSVEYVASKDVDYSFMIQKINVSVNLKDEKLELGKVKPYHRYVNFPVEITEPIKITADDVEIPIGSQTEYVSTLDYDFTLNGDCKESVTLVGNTNVWASADPEPSPLFISPEAMEEIKNWDVSLDNPVSDGKIETECETKKINFREFF